MDRYFFEWGMYKRKNPDKTELDFVKEMIGHYEEANQKHKKQLERNNLSDSELLEYIKEVNFKKYNEEGGDYFDEASILECFREENRRREYNVSSIPLRYFEMQLNRINQNKSVKKESSLLYQGRKLNLSERYKIANKVLDIESKLRTLNISEMDKHELLSFILGCNKDNARNLMNGRYTSNDRDLTGFYNEYDLNK